ncbi:MAG TPA: RNA 2',3'-cyclic phosphodiesterase [Acidimicrobiia bacterium]
MSGLHRAFVAVVPPPSVRAWADAAAHPAELLVPDLRWTRAEQRHITLQFLGPVADPAPVAEFVADAVRGRAPFTLSLGGGGAFPDARHASVLWLGVREGLDALTALATALASPDDRPFRAHFTLARANKPRDLRQAIAALDASGESESWTVDEVVLFDSENRADRSTHTEQARFRLVG